MTAAIPHTRRSLHSRHYYIPSLQSPDSHVYSPTDNNNNSNNNKKKKIIIIIIIIIISRTDDTRTIEERKMCHVGRYSNTLTHSTNTVDTLAQSYLPMTSQTTGAVAEAAADRKTAKYAPLTQSYLFVPIAVKTMGAINRVGKQFLSDLEGALRKWLTKNARAPSSFNASRWSSNATTRSPSFALTSSVDELLPLQLLQLWEDWHMPVYWHMPVCMACQCIIHLQSAHLGIIH